MAVAQTQGHYWTGYSTSTTHLPIADVCVYLTIHGHMSTNYHALVGGHIIMGTALFTLDVLLIRHRLSSSATLGYLNY